MLLDTSREKYRVKPGPEAYLSPAAAVMGIVLPNESQALIEGELVAEDTAILALAEKLLTAKNPTFFPGPQVLWVHSDASVKKAIALQAMVAQVPGMKTIPMPDYRPKYPKINPEIEINPNHPNLTIWHNDIDVCVFAGVHCHYANIALKIIRASTDCYTIALCGERGHEDAMITLRDVDTVKIGKIRQTILKARKGGQYV